VIQEKEKKKEISWIFHAHKYQRGKNN